MQSRWRARVGAVALLVVSLGATGLIAELVIRFSHVSVGSVYINRKTITLDPNPRLQYSLAPNSVARAEVEYQVNSLGTRGPETSREKPARSRRIVVSGDSIAFGYWVAVEDAFPLQIQKLANATTTSPDVEVINLGVPGYNLGQEFELLQESGLRYTPDLVIVSVCLNDLETIFNYEYGLASARANERKSSPWTRLRSAALDHSMLAAWLEYRFARLDFRRNWATARFTVDADPAVTAESHAGLVKQGRSLTAALRTFARLLRINGNIPGLVVLFPGLDYDFEIYPHLAFHELVAQAAAASGLEFLDLFDCFSRYPAEDLAVDPVHPNPIGHRVAAHAIVEAIGRRQLLPGADLDADSLGDCGEYRIEEFPTVRGY